VGATNLTRRRFLGAALAGGAGLTLSSASGRLVERAIAAGRAVGTKCASLSDIDHIVILVQENRSFDHYFGSYPGVAGFSDPAVLTQPGHAG
jgi:phospholipase C